MGMVITNYIYIYHGIQSKGDLIIDSHTSVYRYSIVTFMLILLNELLPVTVMLLLDPEHSFE